MCLGLNVLFSVPSFVPAPWCGCVHVCFSVYVCFCTSVCVDQIVGNGSEQQLQRELEDVLMDPSVADAGHGPGTGMDSLGVGGRSPLPTTASPVAPGSDPLSSSPPKLEIVLPVQTAQESELNERSYRGEPSYFLFFYFHFSCLSKFTHWLF